MKARQKKKKSLILKMEGKLFFNVQLNLMFVLNFIDKSRKVFCSQAISFAQSLMDCFICMLKLPKCSCY